MRTRAAPPSRSRLNQASPSSSRAAPRSPLRRAKPSWWPPISSASLCQSSRRSVPSAGAPGDVDQDLPLGGARAQPAARHGEVAPDLREQSARSFDQGLEVGRDRGVRRLRRVDLVGLGGEAGGVRRGREAREQAGERRRLGRQGVSRLARGEALERLDLTGEPVRLLREHGEEAGPALGRRARVELERLGRGSQVADGAAHRAREHLERPARGAGRGLSRACHRGSGGCPRRALASRRAW